MEIMQEFDQLREALPKYNQEAYKKETDDLKQKLAEVANLDCVPARREISINYRGIVAKVQ
eukprot:7783954-Prorocentrum_lima.AAC.1